MLLYPSSKFRSFTFLILLSSQATFATANAMENNGFDRLLSSLSSACQSANLFLSSQRDNFLKEFFTAATKKTSALVVESASDNVIKPTINYFYYGFVTPSLYHKSLKTDFSRLSENELYFDSTSNTLFEEYLNVLETSQIDHPDLPRLVVAGEKGQGKDTFLFKLAKTKMPVKIYPHHVIANASTNQLDYFLKFLSKPVGFRFQDFLLFPILRKPVPQNKAHIIVFKDFDLLQSDSKENFKKIEKFLSLRKSVHSFVLTTSDLNVTTKSSNSSTHIINLEKTSLATKVSLLIHALKNHGYALSEDIQNQLTIDSKLHGHLENATRQRIACVARLIQVVLKHSDSLSLTDALYQAFEIRDVIDDAVSKAKKMQADKAKKKNESDLKKFRQIYLNKSIENLQKEFNDVVENPS